MFEKALVMYIYAETPIHPGSGAALGAVDLPIQRERHTEFPMIQGSSLKGVLRSHAQSVGISEMEESILFGEPDRVGGVSVTDARVLAFPVRSLKGLFGWVTCPFVLDRFKRDMNIAGKNITWAIPNPSGENKAIVKADSNLIIKDNVYLEDLKLDVETYDKLNEITRSFTCALPDTQEYRQLSEKVEKDLVILTDDLFRDLVTMTTEITTRVRIGEEGVVEEGPWSEEYIPTDTIMYSLILIPGRMKGLTLEEIIQKLRQYDNKILHIGGDETIGKGFARIKIL
ncbi:type III-B CRISPR module RAMP protein Cmr4 [Archaeoglobales archaeon]|nr:MAG: type III-B CRISPR module RAMP protein Cmr4 [Archaeoglobales archaeon]